jgi:hypothetical protein
MMVGRPNRPTRQAAPAFDGLQHRRLFAANIGSRAAAEVDAHARVQSFRFDPGNLFLEDVEAGRIFVADIDVDGLHLGHPGRDQHALEEAVRVAFQVMAVLEGARLALVAVDRHEPGFGLLAYDFPLEPGGKTGAAQPAQTGVLHQLDQVVRLVFAGVTVLQEPVPAIGDVGVEIHIDGNFRVGRAIFDTPGEVFDGGLVDVTVAHLGHGCRVAAPHAGGTHHPHLAAQGAGQGVEQCLCAHHLAGQAVAHADGEIGRPGFLLQHNVEVGIERGDFVHLRQGKRHFRGKGLQVLGLEAAESVLDQVQMFDQQVAPPRPLAKQVADCLQRLGLELTAFVEGRRLSAAGPGMNHPSFRAVAFGCRVCHQLAALLLVSSKEVDAASVRHRAQPIGIMYPNSLCKRAFFSNMYFMPTGHQPLPAQLCRCLPTVCRRARNLR